MRTYMCTHTDIRLRFADEHEEWLRKMQQNYELEKRALSTELRANLEQRKLQLEHAESDALKLELRLEREKKLAQLNEALARLQETGKVRSPGTEKIYNSSCLLC